MSPPSLLKVTPDRLRATLDLSRDLVAVSSHPHRDRQDDDDDDDDDDEDEDEEEEKDAIKPLVMSAQPPRYGRCRINHIFIIERR